MKKIVFFLSFLFLVNTIFANRYNIKDFGATENEVSTKAIQKAVDLCYKKGGGVVVVPAGKFITGTIILKSNVNLYLEQGAVLLGSTNLDDYWESFRKHGIIFCEEAENVSITGQGTIDAQGTTFYDPTQNHVYDEFDKQRTRQKENYMPEGEFYTDGPIKRLPKPGMTISFFHCSRVVLKNFVIKDTPSWAVRFGFCDDVLVKGISIKNNLMIPNSDGVHCTASRNIRMSDCDIRAGDDAFIITGFNKKEDTPGYSLDEQNKFEFGNHSPYAENVNVSNCQFQSRSSGIRVGYGQHPIRNCVFTNITIYGSNRGIGVFAHDAADIENLVFSNIVIQTRLHNGQWWGNGEPIHLSSISRFENEPVGIIRNVQFNNIIATGEHGIIIYGHEDSPMENIRFDNLQLKIVRGKETLTYGGNFDLRPAADSKMQLFEHDISGLFARYINDLSIRDFQLEWGNYLPAFFTHGIHCRHVQFFSIENYHGTPNPNANNAKPLLLENTSLK